MVVTPCWNVNPSSRPNFEAICNDIEIFRNGGEDGDDRGYCEVPKTLQQGTMIVDKRHKEEPRERSQYEKSSKLPA